MKLSSFTAYWFFLFSGLLITPTALGQEPAPPRILSIGNANGNAEVRFSPYPGTAMFRILKSGQVQNGYQDAGGLLSGYDWQGPAGRSAEFFKIEAVPLAPKDVLGSIALNRLAYGPTPDDIERVLTSPTAIGPDAYIKEQLSPESLTEDLGLELSENSQEWEFASVTGTASSSTLYLYLNAPGEVFIDDMILVRGSVAGVGANLLKNGDFESALADTWTVSENHSATKLSTENKRTGNSSLHLVASSAGSTKDSSVWQTFSPALVSGQVYTLSFYYKPTPNTRRFTTRLSGNGILVQKPSLGSLLANGGASISDLQAWHTLHAVRSKRQLLEVLTQFFDNHFTTYYPKSVEYLDGKLTNNVNRVESFIATDFEFRELKNWKSVLLNPNGTFYDMLKFSAESPSMIIYLDTVDSTSGNANENYSREIMELFSMGVDNGYDQADIEEMSRAWTGWRVDKLPIGQENNPFATRVSNRDLTPGYWTLQFRTANHDTKAKTIFAGKTIDPRFGTPHAGKSYQLNLPARTGAAGMQDGYDIVKHLADLPYTQEYISVKLCQLFIHENFHHGVYDYSVATLAPEAALIRDCMRAWDSLGPDGRKGNLRMVLKVIFDSPLFRGYAALRQKVKTPFEYSVSAVRALRSQNLNGSYTADTDGYDFQTALQRLNMRIFYREDPDGWSELAKEWISTASLMERLRFTQNLLAATGSSVKDDDYGTDGVNNVSDPVALLQLKLPSSQWRNAPAVVDFFFDILFLGEGKANLDYDKKHAVAYLNSNDSGAANSSLFASLDPSSAIYNTRVRSLVAYLMSLPRFQEQ